MQEQLTVLKITEDEFWEQYKPVKNHLDDNAGWSGCLYETYNPEKQYCFDLAQKENRVWTVIETDVVVYDPEDDPDEDPDEDDDEVYQPTCMTIISGFHWVDRIGFLITEKSFEEEKEVNIEN
jgi:hypothetical protein